MEVQIELRKKDFVQVSQILRDYCNVRKYVTSALMQCKSGDTVVIKKRK